MHKLFLDAALLPEDVDARVVGFERVNEINRLIVGARMIEDDVVGRPRTDRCRQRQGNVAHATA